MNLKINIILLFIENCEIKHKNYLSNCNGLLWVIMSFNPNIATPQPINHYKNGFFEM